MTGFKYYPPITEMQEDISEVQEDISEVQNNLPIPTPIYKIYVKDTKRFTLNTYEKSREIYVGNNKSDCFSFVAWDIQKSLIDSNGNITTSIPTASKTYFAYICRNFWSGRSSHQCLVFQGKMWILGGIEGYDSNYYKNDVWSSSDGINWTQETASAGWSGRSSHQCLVFQDKMWILGGKTKKKTYNNDVWSSSDGINWTQETASAGWSARHSHQCLTFQNKMWILGGVAEGEGFPPDITMTDVWSSSDGINWTQETASAGWTNRYFLSTIFNNKIWIAGGIISFSLSNNVWSSPDGINWTQETASAGWSARYYHQFLVFQNKMWILGGYSTQYNNDVWSSSDGINWTQETASAGWSARHSHQCLAFQNKIWILGGTTEINNECDIWSSSDGINWTKNFGQSGLSETEPIDGKYLTLNKTWLHVANVYVNSSLLLDSYGVIPVYGNHVIISEHGTTNKVQSTGLSGIINFFSFIVPIPKKKKCCFDLLLRVSGSGGEIVGAKIDCNIGQITTNYLTKSITQFDILSATASYISKSNSDTIYTRFYYTTGSSITIYANSILKMSFFD